VAMSGGVDSSVAAILLTEQGYSVYGVHFKIKDSDSGIDLEGLQCETLDLREKFKREIIDNFIEEYRSGRTPNPCIRCNQLIKFDLLLKKAKELGCEYIATGHYARINLQPQTSNVQINRKYQLLKGKDMKKDQSYVLYRLTQEQLAQTLFPLGEMTKEQVRKKAKELKLPVADKEESQEICFIEDDDYGRFIRENAPGMVRPGPILDQAGNKVGEHEGVAFYTIGQRKGIGHHKGEPKYVIAIDPKQNAVIIGDDNDLLKTELQADDLSFISGAAPLAPLEITAKIRYNSTEAEAILDKAKVVFRKPQRAITPGQSVVFYQGEEVIGGGIIR